MHLGIKLLGTIHSRFKPPECVPVTFAKVQSSKVAVLWLVVVTKLLCIIAFLVLNVSPMAFMVPSTLSKGSDGLTAYSVMVPLEVRVMLQVDGMVMLA